MPDELHRVAEYRVWVMEPTGSAADGYVFPWNWSKLRIEPRLICEEYEHLAGNMGSASFQVTRRWRQDEDENVHRLHADLVIPGAWVVVTRNSDDASDFAADDQVDEASVVWWGFLCALPSELVESEDDELGAMTAKEVGHLLDQVALHGWSRADALAEYPDPIQSPPTANLQIKDGQVIGNAKQLDGAGYDDYVFAAIPDHCGTASSQIWSRWRLLQHMLAFCKPGALPELRAVVGSAESIVDIAFEVAASPPLTGNTPPGTPVDGAAYHLGNAPTGAWAGHADELAVYDGTSWSFHPAVFLVDDGAGLSFAGHEGEIATWNTDTDSYDFSDPAEGTAYRLATDGSYSQRSDAEPGSGDPLWETEDLLGYLDSTADPEVYDLRNLKWKGALDMLFPFSQGLDWDVRLGRNSWTFAIVSASDSDDYGVPAATLTEIDLTGAAETAVNLKPNVDDMPDEVRFEGGLCFFGFSVAKTNGNLDKYWQDLMRAAYDAADQEDRTQPQYDDVYTLFRLKPNDDHDLRRSDEPGDNDQDDGPLVPEVHWDGTTAKLDNSVSRCPYLPTARIASIVPWEAGRKSDGTDTRDALRKAQPAYLQPMVFNHEPDISPHWIELTDDPIGWFGQGRPSIASDDRAAALRIRASPQHEIAIDDFEGVDGGALLDWQKFVVTVGMHSDQRVSAVRRRVVEGEEMSATSVRRVLTLRDDSLGFWCTLKGTVLGVKWAAGELEPDRLTATNILEKNGGTAFGYVIRNDFPKVERNVKRLSAWAFRPRSSGTIALAKPDALPAWVAVGVMAGQLKERLATGQTEQVERTVNGLIRGYRVSLVGAARVTVTIDTPPQPTFSKAQTISSPSPSAGGAVSPTIGGTVPQAVQRLQQVVRDIQSDTQHRLIIPPLQRIQTTQIVQVIGGQVEDGVDIIQYSLADPTLAKVYDPDVDTTYPAGLGRGWLMDARGHQVERVLVRNDFAGMAMPLVGGWSYIVGRTTTLDLSSSSAPPGSPATGDQVVVGDSGTGDFAGHDGEVATWDGAAWTFEAGGAQSNEVYTITWPA
jgi:hypothetical protein